MVTDLSGENFAFPRVDPRDPVGRKFHWVSSSEPHMLRRRELLSKYGDKVRALSRGQWMQQHRGRRTILCTFF